MHVTRHRTVAAAAVAPEAVAEPSVAEKETDAENEDEFVHEDEDEVDVKRLDVRRVPIAPVLASAAGAGSGADEAALDRISKQVLAQDPHAVLFHRIYPFSTRDTRTLDYLITATLKRAEITKNPTIASVRDYLVVAIALQTSLDRQHGDIMFKGVRLSSEPVFRMGQLQTSDLKVDILYWLSVLGTDSVWMMLDFITIRLNEVFKIPIEQSPLFEVREKLSEPTSVTGRRLASIAFAVLANDVRERWGVHWGEAYVFKYDDVKFPAASTQAHRLKFEYIEALRWLMSAIMELASWLSDKEIRSTTNEKINYNLKDVSTLNICIHQIQKATALLLRLERQHALGVELFHGSLLDLVSKLRAFAIASEIMTRPAERPYAAWYLTAVPIGWFPELEKEVFAGMTKEMLKRHETDPEPAIMADRFTHKVSQSYPGAFDLVRLPEDIWPRLQLVVTQYDTRVSSGMSLVPKRKTGKP